MKKTVRRFKKFNLYDPEDEREYNELLNDPLVNVTERELIDEKTIHSDGEGGSRTEIRPIYLVHWEEQVL